MTTLLALDTATAACSAAVWRDGAVAAREFALLDRGHADQVIPMVQTAMTAAGLDYPALDAIAVTVGPGTFTGVRIGLAAARGLALAAGRPMIGVTTLDAIAHGVPARARAGAPVLATIDARRGQIYGQYFNSKLSPISDPIADAPDRLLAGAPVRDFCVAGTGAAIVAAAVETTVLVLDEPGHPDAAVVAGIAATRSPSAPHTVTPLYLRAPDAVRRPSSP